MQRSWGPEPRSTSSTTSGRRADQAIARGRQSDWTPRPPRSWARAAPPCRSLPKPWERWTAGISGSPTRSRTSSLLADHGGDRRSSSTWQMQRAQPERLRNRPSSRRSLECMPLMFAFCGSAVPRRAWFVYWTVSNGLQVAQQTYPSRRTYRPRGPRAPYGRAESEGRDTRRRRGVMSWMTGACPSRAEPARSDTAEAEVQGRRLDAPAEEAAEPRLRRSRPAAGRRRPPSRPRWHPGRRRKGAAPGNQLRPNPKPDQREDEH